MLLIRLFTFVSCSAETNGGSSMILQISVDNCFTQALSINRKKNNMIVLSVKSKRYACSPGKPLEQQKAMVKYPVLHYLLILTSRSTPHLTTSIILATALPPLTCNSTKGTWVFLSLISFLPL